MGGFTKCASVGRGTDYILYSKSCSGASGGLLNVLV